MSLSGILKHWLDRLTGTARYAAIAVYGAGMVAVLPVAAFTSSEGTSEGKISLRSGRAAGTTRYHQPSGSNRRALCCGTAGFGYEPCDIHFHKYAEHRVAGYLEIAGTGSHKGYVCNGSKPAEGHGESHRMDHEVVPGDTTRYIGCSPPAT